MRWLIPIAMLGVVACASTTSPPEQVVTEARAAIHEAFTAGATDVPDAKHYLQQAEEHFQAAAGEAGREAVRLYERARMDARLATQLADEHRALDRERRAREWLDRIDRAARQSHRRSPDSPAGENR